MENPVPINPQPTKTSWFSKYLTLDYLITHSPELIIRFGFAFVLLYAAFYVANPETGSKYVPQFVTDVIPIGAFLTLFGGFEIVLALWILSGVMLELSALIFAAMLIAVTLCNLDYFSALFRNVAIICAALSLVVMKLVEKRKKV